MGVAIDRSGVGRWRYTCPRGHVRWKRTEAGIWCAACGRAPRFKSGSYETIIDQKTRTEIPFEEVELQ